MKTYDAVAVTKDYADTLQFQYHVVTVENTVKNFIYCHLQENNYNPSFWSSTCNCSLLKTPQVKCVLFK